MTDYNNTNKEPVWKEKLKYYAKIGLLLVVAIWIFNIANSAQNLASENASIVQVPEYTIYHVSGGPKRFSSEFDDTIEDQDKKIQGDYLWSSIVIENTGEKDAENVGVDITAAVPIAKVLVNAPGYYNEAEIEHKKNTNEAKITLEDFANNDQTIIFIGMIPQGYQKPFNEKKWTNEYQNYLQKVTVESDQATAKYFASGYTALFE